MFAPHTDGTGMEFCLLERQPAVRERLTDALTREGLYLSVTARDERALRGILPLLPGPPCLLGGGATRDFLQWLEGRLPAARAEVLWDGQPGLGAVESRSLGATWLEARRTSPAQLASVLRGLAAAAPASTAPGVLPQQPPVLARLSPREREVLSHVAPGADNLTISACLDITERTVRAHVSALYLKVGGENRAQLALRGRELGLWRPSRVERPCVPARWPPDARDVPAADGQVPRSRVHAGPLRSSPGRSRLDAHRTLAHDLRTPLCAMRLNAEPALRTLGEGSAREEAARRLAAILRQVAWMAELVEAQLVRVPAAEVVPVTEFVRVGVERLRPLAEARAARLQEACGGTAAVRVRPALAQQVLANLVVNALEHGPARGDVWVEAGPADGAWVRLRVRDEGPPLSAEAEAEAAARLLRPGEKGAPSRGQGLGLAIAAEAVRAHGGRLWQEPGTPRGNAFSFTLPAA
ncbi:MAG: hypothetical protein FJ086_00910 [Deltaproteobacteria bacterium]|nr:hypothetical protein [Deltaproteobacteria bacterium]